VVLCVDALVSIPSVGVTRPWSLWNVCNGVVDQIIIHDILISVAHTCTSPDSEADSFSGCSFSSNRRLKSITINSLDINTLYP